MVRPRQVTRGGRGLQDRQPEDREKTFSSLLDINKQEVICQEHFMKVKKLSESNVPFIESIHSFSLPPHLNSGGSLPQATENKDEFKNNSSIPFPSNTRLLYPVTAAVVLL